MQQTRTAKQTVLYGPGKESQASVVPKYSFLAAGGAQTRAKRQLNRIVLHVALCLLNEWRNRRTYVLS